jgi:hypothetical protein
LKSGIRAAICGARLIAAHPILSTERARDLLCLCYLVIEIVRSIGHPLSGTIAKVLPFLPGDLVPPAALGRVEEVARRLPAALARQLYFECRLAGTSSRVDLIVRVDRDGAAILAGRNPALALDRQLAAAPVWRRIGELARRWLDAGRADDALEALWLEFDLPEDRSFGGADQPRLFIELRQGWLRAASVACLVDLTLAMTRVARGARGTTTARAMRGVLGCLPDPGHLRYVGCDPHSPGGSLRLCFARLEDAAIGRLCGTQVLDGFRVALEAIGATTRPNVLNLDVGQQVLPGAGLELTLERPPQLRGDIRERSLLDALVRVGLSSQSRIEALAHWPGHSRTVMSHEIWPSWLVRRLNHVKLRVEEHRVTEAKAYLTFAHRFAIAASLYR